MQWSDKRKEGGRMRFVDDDNDGDKDIFYQLGDTIYRKENYTKTPEKRYIKDKPQVIRYDNIPRILFDQKNWEQLFTDNQIYWSRSSR